MRDNGGDLSEYGPVLTPEEVAEVLQLNQEHLVRLMRNGEFPGFRVKGTWRVKRSALQDVLDGTWRPEPATGSVDEVKNDDD
jgi:excisionase family DNA binding protein